MSHETLSALLDAAGWLILFGVSLAACAAVWRLAQPLLMLVLGLLMRLGVIE
jgi:hypothetical protein